MQLKIRCVLVQYVHYYGWKAVETWPVSKPNTHLARTASAARYAQALALRIEPLLLSSQQCDHYRRLPFAWGHNALSAKPRSTDKAETLDSGADLSHWVPEPKVFSLANGPGGSVHKF